MTALKSIVSVAKLQTRLTCDEFQALSRFYTSSASARTALQQHINLESWSRLREFANYADHPQLQEALIQFCMTLCADIREQKTHSYHEVMSFFQSLIDSPSVSEKELQAYSICAFSFAFDFEWLETSPTAIDIFGVEKSTHALNQIDISMYFQKDTLIPAQRHFCMMIQCLVKRNPFGLKLLEKVQAGCASRQALFSHQWVQLLSNALRADTVTFNAFMSMAKRLLTTSELVQHLRDFFPDLQGPLPKENVLRAFFAAAPELVQSQAFVQRLVEIALDTTDYAGLCALEMLDMSVLPPGISIDCLEKEHVGFIKLLKDRGYQLSHESVSQVLGSSASVQTKLAFVNTFPDKDWMSALWSFESKAWQHCTGNIRLLLSALQEQGSQPLEDHLHQAIIGGAPFSVIQCLQKARASTSVSERCLEAALDHHLTTDTVLMLIDACDSSISWDLFLKSMESDINIIDALTDKKMRNQPLSREQFKSVIRLGDRDLLRYMLTYHLSKLPEETFSSVLRASAFKGNLPEIPDISGTISFEVDPFAVPQQNDVNAFLDYLFP